jgi:flavin reductase (DIM6/NTAB) family NADH-FMN oxidoreductase RutF
VTSLEKQFERLMGSLDYPLFVVTAADGEERDGCIVGFATQCSIDPQLFLVCLSVKNRTYRIAERASALAVHFVPRERTDVAELFGGETADETDKLARVEWHPGPEGVPVVESLPNWFAGRIEQRVDLGGDHAGFVLAPVAAEVSAPREEDELCFQEAKDIEPGHEP